jgi:hypothetical protein
MAPRTEYNRKWRQDHLEEQRAYDRTRYAEHVEEKREYARQYRVNTPGLNERLRDQQRVRRTARRDAVFAHYGEKCACCGRTSNLSIDHVNGDGAEHRLTIPKGTPSLYKWLIENDFPDDFQVLCGPCNSSKGRGAACQLHPKVA